MGIVGVYFNSRIVGKVSVWFVFFPDKQIKF